MYDPGGFGGGGSRERRPFIDHYISSTTYTVMLGENGILFYLDLSGTYIEQETGEGIRGPKKIGNPLIIPFEARGVFAEAKLFFAWHRNTGQPEFSIQFDFTHLQNIPGIFAIGVLPSRCMRVEKEDVERHRKNGALIPYIADRLMASVDIDITQAAHVTSGIGTKGGFMEALIRSFEAKRFVPKPLENPLRWEELKPFCHKPQPGSYVHEALCKIIDSQGNLHHHPAGYPFLGRECPYCW